MASDHHDSAHYWHRLASVFTVTFCVTLGLFSPRAVGATEAEVTQPPMPVLDGFTRRDGRGVPNGHTDSTAPFARLTGVSDDESFGYTEANPIRVGNGDMRAGPRNEREYLNALRSRNGNPVEYERLGSCCAFKSSNGFQGGGLLDVYRISTPENMSPIRLYFNMYDPGEPLAPKGFTIRSDQ